MRFTKMHGLGNDFVVVDGPIHLSHAQLADLCHRRLGVGADGVLAVSTNGLRITMHYWNADGSAAEMCGNGLRCVARYALDRGLVDSPRFEVDTPVGVRGVSVELDRISVELGRVEMGPTVVFGARSYQTVMVGNPHAVTEVDDPDRIDVSGLGEGLQQRFSSGTNVEFYTGQGPDAIRMRVWERGVGETLACGSGMVAAAAVHRGVDGPDRLSVEVPGGSAFVEFVDGSAWLIGAASYVFVGDWPFSGPV